MKFVLVGGTVPYRVLPHSLIILKKLQEFPGFVERQKWTSAS